jgi:citrate synthase
VTAPHVEATAALLWQGLVPAPEGAEALRAALAAAREEAFARLSPVLPALAGLPPIDGLRGALAALPDGDDAAVRVAAAIPVATAALWRLAHGEAPVAPSPGAAQAWDFLYMLHGHAPRPAHVAALDGYLTTVADHGMNASTFTGRVVASTRAGIVSSVVAALCALKGPLHGGAPGPVLDMLDAIGSADNAEAWLTAQLDAGARLMGFGHRIYRTRDPRADVLRAALARLGADEGRLALARRVEAVAHRLLKVRYPGRNLDTNVEFYTALLLDAVGLPRGLFTCAFAMGRVLGWVAHACEQAATGRIIRPASRYVGPAPAGVELAEVAG